jgi:hypothetical protein
MQPINHKLVIFLCLLSARSFSQPTFTSIDSLLSKTYSAVNLKDSAIYVSLLNQTHIYLNKKCKTSSDSLVALKAFTTSFKNLVNELAEISGTPDFTVGLVGYELFNFSNSKGDDKVRVQVKLLINNNFTVKMLLIINKLKELYTIENPLLVGFLVE